MTRSLAKRKQLMQEGRGAKKSLTKRKKERGQERIFTEHFGGIERSDFCDFEKPRPRACQKRKIDFGKEGGQPK